MNRPKFPRPRHCLEVSGQRHSPAALPTAMEPTGRHWTGGWVGPRRSACSKLPRLELRSLGHSVGSQSLYGLQYLDSQVLKRHLSEWLVNLVSIESRISEREIWELIFGCGREFVSVFLQMFSLHRVFP
jgi:hypothetical protein